MAATLLVGIGIGRYAMERSGSEIQPVLTAQGPADAGRIAAPAEPKADAPADAATQSVGAEGASEPTDAPRTQPLQRAPRSDIRLAAAAAPNTTRNGTANGAEPVDAFQLASRDHLVRAEALVSVVAATPADAVMDSLTGRWAREMLTNTRLLLDSPAGDDPVRRRLLEDLETVLVQLVQRSGGAVDERALIDRTLERTQLLTRLRTNAAGI
jgi:hypothetical protein